MLAGSTEGIPVPDTGDVRTDLAAFARALAGAIVDRAVGRGELPAGTDTGLALELLCSPVQTRALLGHRPIEPDLPERLADTVLNGLRGRT
ncbi:TetR-like C-terminal domain-containing protein [Streptomyces sp. NRRL S-495]|uniref:TetR-like C-terminal domain-containing protein n=1 Tax=Streptomyces sp. NRRL S-495 TaxID=1609133 RepID=UPI000698C45B|nr:TetR-like C-terminal domain-containing protein [Streptomyces sp. NRRL S-495]